MSGLVIVARTLKARSPATSETADDAVMSPCLTSIGSTSPALGISRTSSIRATAYALIPTTRISGLSVCWLWCMGFCIYGSSDVSRFGWRQSARTSVPCGVDRYYRVHVSDRDALDELFLERPVLFFSTYLRQSPQAELPFRGFNPSAVRLRISVARASVSHRDALSAIPNEISKRRCASVGSTPTSAGLNYGDRYPTPAYSLIMRIVFRRHNGPTLCAAIPNVVCRCLRSKG